MLIPLAIVSALLAQSSPPSPSELIDRAMAAEKTQGEKGWKYTYREDHEQSQLDKNGKAGPPSTKTYDHIMLEGAEYKKLVLIDGKPLDAKTQKKVDEDLEKTRSERRKLGFLSTQRTVALGGLNALERFFNNKVTGEETMLGRRTWRMESEPKAGYKASNKHEEEILASRHVSWFDQQEGDRIKWRDEFVHAANGFQPGTTVDWEFAKVGDAWLFDNTVLRMDMKWAPGIHGRAESRQRFYDYKRFTVDSTLTTQ